jgi:molybdate transport system substrate-binding protein
MMNRRSLLLAALFVPGAPVAAAAKNELTVFAAASLTDVLQEVGSAYTARTGAPVRFSFAASSALARQIESGSPAGAFVSADQDWMNYLAERKLIDAATRADVVTNALVLIAPADSKLQLEIVPGFALAQALGRNGRLSTGDPESVPAGRYAKAALRKLGVWDSVSARMIAADNVRTALNFVALGEAPVGIVYATDVRGNDKVRVVDTFPAGTHEPIRYPAAATARGGAQAAAFVRFLQTEQARGIFRNHGFGIPEKAR